MSASDHLSELQFHYDAGHVTGEHRILAQHPKHGMIGEMTWDPDTGVIDEIQVSHDPDFRRQGVATAMWNHAHANVNPKKVKPPRHNASRTKEGDEWAKSVGGHLPPLHLVTF